jgi:hypothetical protein
VDGGAGYLSLTYVSADLAMPYPVVAASVTGTVTGVLTLAGGDIAVSATKPGGDVPWTLQGTLLEGLTLDLADAAGSFTSTALAVPSDAVRNGLPTATTISAASMTGIPDTGEFHFAGQVDFDWSFSLGPAQVSIRSISGTSKSRDPARCRPRR